MWRRTLQLLRQLGKPSDSISERDVKLFCRHASDIHVERGTCIADEYDPKIFDTSNIGNILKAYIISTYRVSQNYRTHETCKFLVRIEIEKFFIILKSEASFSRYKQSKFTVPASGACCLNIRQLTARPQIRAFTHVKHASMHVHTRVPLTVLL